MPGGLHDPKTGDPIQDARLRCETERWLKNEMQSYRRTILSGGSRGLNTEIGTPPRSYLELHPSERGTEMGTEAWHMRRWLVEQGEPESDYLLEPVALETIGNLVFSTKLLLIYGLTRPVFVSQAHHAFRLQSAASHWFWRSNIKAHFRVVQSYNQEASVMAQEKGILDSLSSGGSRGFGFSAFRFQHETLSLPPDGWEAPTTKWAFEVAIRWLFRFAEGSTGLRYPQEYGNVDTFLAAFL